MSQNSIPMMTIYSGNVKSKLEFGHEKKYKLSYFTLHFSLNQVRIGQTKFINQNFEIIY